MSDLRVRLKIRRKKAKPLARLSEPEYDGFQNNTESYLAELTPKIAHMNPEEQWQQFSEKIVNALDFIAKKPMDKKDWMSEEVWSNIKLRKELKSGERPENFEVKYSQMSRLIQRQCRRDKNQYLENICTEIEHHADKYQTADLFRKVKQITHKVKPSSWVIDDKNGNPIHEVAKVAERWKEYCEELYQDQSSKSTSSNKIIGDEEPSILRSEVEDAIRKLKRNKAPGPDRITAEVLKGLGSNGITCLHNICNRIWHTGLWPSDWVHSAILPLHKKGSMRNCSNYRTIALISHASKVLLNILNARLRAFLDWQIPQEQAGFVKERGTREQILNLRLIIEKCYEYNTPTFMCFVDYQKAFDCVKWEKLWKVLTEAGVPSHLVMLIRNLYESSYGTVTVGDTTSSRFTFQKGVRQGCISSPILFNIYGEHIMRQTLEDWEGGIKIGGVKISNLRYADDTTLFASSENEMAELLRRLETASLEMGLAINKSKTKLMIVDRFDTIQRTDILQDYETVNQFQYLGSLITNKGSSEPEIRRRIGMAKTAMTQLSKVWKDRNIRYRTKIHLVRTLVFSIALYGAETWTFKAADRLRIDAFEMWCWRRMLQIPWTAFRTNVSILQQLKLEKTKRLSTTCLQRIVRYFGHVARRDTNNLERLMVTGKIEGKRPRGRSPKRWSDQISEELEISVSTALHQATERNRWRQLVDEIKRSHDPQH